MQPTLTAEYELTKEDWSAFNFYHHFHSPTARRQYRRAWFFSVVLVLVLCLVISVLASLNSPRPGSTFVALLPLYSGVLFCLFWFPWVYRRKVRKIVAGMIGEGRNRTLLGRQRVTISPEGISRSSDFDQSTISWSGIEQVVKDKNYAFVYTSALSAIIVPRRAFADDIGFDAFVMKATGYHQEAGASLPLGDALRR
jgi:YcxB-like protein